MNAQMRHEPEMLAGLIGQAEEEGASLVTLRALVEEAGELGASRVLERIGLGDARAGGDIVELRELLAAWRVAKGSALKAVVGWLTRGMIALLLAGMAVKHGFLGKLLS